eukprot:CAMPEP_0201584222 /NCGR_PEP_ID=MMETSP0190_2-20130828/107932_1 /ASSEMBLY_ACC=CAM_ASM_000263 /TAXON_ID=37353 /ORGANISM="Rosalina sp." /LENGTH=160 /DNA_ID=CAMNT_0048027775 /DNA_START=6 /DNA_END=485 /DNA_ORIENTATION=+
MAVYFAISILFFYIVNGQTNGSLPLISTSPPQTTIFATEEYRFDIDVTIIVNYSINSTLNSNIDKSIIESELISLLNSQNLEEFLITIQIIIQDSYIDIEMSINTNNDKDVDTILEYVKSDQFEESIKGIIEQSNNNIKVLNVSIVDIEYRDNEEIKLDW